MMKAKYTVFLCLLGFFWNRGMAQAQRGQIARETAEFIVQRFGSQAAHGGTAALARRLETMAARHGDEVFQAARRVGPQFFQVVERAGQYANQAVGVMARHGEPGVAWVLNRPQGMSLLLAHGDDAARVLVRHPGGITEPVLQQFGRPAVSALQSVGPQNGRRMAMLLSDGQLARIGRTPELMGVVSKFGDKAMDFIWKNKGTLAVGAALTAFLLNPEPFLNGAKDLTKIAAENAVKPLAEIPGKVAEKVAEKVDWTLFSLVGLGVVALLLLPLAWKFAPSKREPEKPKLQQSDAQA